MVVGGRCQYIIVSAKITFTGQVTRAMHVRNRVCPLVELI